MHCVIAGGTGFLGRELARALRADGHTVTILSRRPAAPAAAADGTRNVTWQPDGSVGPWLDACRDADTFVNLAGESIAARRWTDAQKARLVSSRLLATRSLAAAARALAPRPLTVLSGSATGFYGNRPGEVVDETAPAGHGFLADLATAWEREALDAGPSARVVLVRTGLVLDPREGALAKMLPPFRLGLGGPFGDGRQMMSWIHRDDWVSLVCWCLKTPTVTGPVNAVAPRAVDNRAFSRALARVLRRPALMAVPAFVLRLALGEMADALLLDGQDVRPAAVLASGFQFGHPDLEPALRDLLGLGAR